MAISNIYVGNPGQNAESSTIRIGNLQTQAFFAGISGVTVTGAQVLIDSNGQLGTVLSSRRFKEQIQDMGDASSNIMRLRPVTFRYRPEYLNGPSVVQYGLVAEEVADVYPGLVQYSKTGEPNTVIYHLLTPMLLNEVQKLHEKIVAQQEQLAVQGDRMDNLVHQQQEIVALKVQYEQQLAAMAARLAALESRNNTELSASITH